MKLEESVIGGCLLDHHSPSPVSSGSQQQPDLSKCSTMAADEEIPEETTSVDVRAMPRILLLTNLCCYVPK